jgi:hypothetical protein
VRIEGPVEAVRQCREARTRDISVEGRQQTFEQDLWVDVVNPDVRFDGEPRARATVVIRETTVERTFSDIPIAAADSPHDVKVTPRTVRVSLRGPARLLGNVVREQIVAYLEVSQLEPRAEDYPVAVQVSFNRDLLREKLKVEAVTPPAVAVHVSPRKPERRGEKAR